jgi:hypothetical protein
MSRVTKGPGWGAVVIVALVLIGLLVLMVVLTS